MPISSSPPAAKQKLTLQRLGPPLHINLWLTKHRINPIRPLHLHLSAEEVPEGRLAAREEGVRELAEELCARRVGEGRAGEDLRVFGPRR